MSNAEKAAYGGTGTGAYGWVVNQLKQSVPGLSDEHPVWNTIGSAAGGLGGAWGLGNLWKAYRGGAARRK